MPKMTPRTVSSMREKSATLAAPVKSSWSTGGLMKAIWAAPIFKIVSGNAEGTVNPYQRYDVRQRTQQDGQSAMKLHTLDTLHLVSRVQMFVLFSHQSWDVIRIHFNVGFANPIDVEVELDAV